MKRLISVLVAVFFMTGMVVAQDNESIVNQSGSDIDATVTQTGEGNFSELNQTDDWIDGHSATIEQIGDNNYSAINTQNGGGTADVLMDGDRNKLLNYNLDEESFANQKNSLNLFELDIYGSDNRVGMSQEFAKGDVDITGSENQIQLMQKSAANYQVPDFHTAEITVEGDVNEVDVQQGPYWGFGYKGNEAKVQIINQSNLNDVKITQLGDKNSAFYKIGAGDENDVILEQKGEGHHISNVQILSNSNDNNVDIMQDGRNHRGLWVISRGAEDNYLDVTQEDGINNRATGRIWGNDNDVDVLQQGSENWVGAGNWNDKQGVRIDGNMNTVDIHQMGNGNMSVNTVTGNGNTINVTQQQ